ncbi:CTTNBP2 N-terminal-like protein isoform X2 [Macrosteles quadrilineatus]|uniref:CTTNBP2 N-terminal-like protein isoform X2 n=1 Tax=Macrosteles quadrilineatus TaxID=74068 RepID=UPI0023E19264|nr:CTTNBP2 N-terminal-like protein isoform X2 [Macrosteles quadrilineatus]
MATNNTSKNQCQGSQLKSFQNQQPQQQQSSLPQPHNVNYEPLEKSTSNTLKRNPKMEFNKADLLKLLSYLEGELQARDIVIATLKSEKVKQLLLQGRNRPLALNEPLAALHRDNFAAVNTKVDEAQICSLAEHQLSSLENLVLQQRRAQIRIARVLKDAELRHRKVVQELVEEKRKHEHDTAQGDDITYGLEKERTRLKQELEVEKQAKKRLEKELKKLTDMAEEEKNRQKQIVLLLLAERKKIIMKYVEERKRSEDLAQILTEEKGRMDSMAEGLEEESKKSLQMEAELEKQLAQFDSESQQLKANLMKEEKRAKELEAELEKARSEVASLEKQLAEAHQVAMFQANTNLVGPMVHPTIVRGPPPPSKPSIIPPQTSPRLTPPGKSSVWVEGSVEGATPMMSVAKVVQPTATVSSVPVCGPTTGIARSVSPGQSLRNVAVAFPSNTMPAQASAEVEKRVVGAVPVPVTGAGVATAPRTAAPVAAKMFAPGGPAKVGFLGSIADGKKQPAIGRGAPPPVPPNKPVVPPKKDTILCRRGDAPVPSDENKSSPQTLKYGILAKENKVVHSGGGDQMEL